MKMITGTEPGQSKFTLIHHYLQLHHRLLSPSLGAVGAPKFQPLIELEFKQLLLGLVETLRDSPRDGMTISSSKVYALL
jgi:hypothetical protein